MLSTRRDWAAVPVERVADGIDRQMIWGERLMVCRLRMAPHVVTAAHSHPHEQITLVERGRVLFSIEDGTREVTAGGIVHFPPGVRHGATFFPRSNYPEIKPVKEGDTDYLKKVWWYDCNPPERKKFKYPDAEGPSEINATPVFWKNRIYTAVGQDPEHGEGVGRLVCQNRVEKLIASHIGTNPVSGQKMNSGEMKVTLVPQGTFAERIRAKGAGQCALHIQSAQDQVADRDRNTHLGAGLRKQLVFQMDRILGHVRCDARLSV